MSKTIATRSSNKSQPPGLPDAKAKRRTTAEVMATKKADVMQKASQVATRAKNIKEVATFQNQTQADNEAVAKFANRPPMKLTQKVARPIAEIDVGDYHDGLL